MVSENELSIDKSRKMARFLEGIRALAEEHGSLRNLIVRADDGETVETLQITKNAERSAVEVTYAPGHVDINPLSKPIAAEPRIKPRQRAKQWLLEQLRDGKRPSSELVEQAKAEQICGERTLDTASRELGIRAIKESGTRGRWFWELPE